MKSTGPSALHTGRFWFSPVLPSFLMVVLSVVRLSQPSNLSFWYCSFTWARFSSMLMGDCLALLQEGNFLAQLFWFNVPGGRENDWWRRMLKSASFYRLHYVTYCFSPSCSTRAASSTEAAYLISKILYVFWNQPQGSEKLNVEDEQSEIKDDVRLVLFCFKLWSLTGGIVLKAPERPTTSQITGSLWGHLETFPSELSCQNLLLFKESCSHFQPFLRQTNPDIFHRKSDHLHPWSWRPKQVF